MPDQPDPDGDIRAELERLRRRVAELEGDRLVLDNLFRDAPVGLCLVDPELRFVRINRQMAEISGASVEAHIGRPVGEVIPQLADQIVPRYRHILETGHPIRNLEMTGRAPSDPFMEHTWLVNHHPIQSSEGGVVAIYTVVIDVTIQKLTADALRSAQERLVEAQRLAGIGSWEWDLVRDRVWWSPELYQMFAVVQGYFEPSFDAFFDRVHPDDRPVIRQQLDATFARNEPYAVEFRSILPSGEIRFIRARADLKRGPDGSPQRLIGTAQDVTDERRLARASASVAAAAGSDSPGDDG